MKKNVFTSLLALAFIASSVLTITAAPAAKFLIPPAVRAQTVQINFSDFNGAISASWKGISFGEMLITYQVVISGYVQSTYNTGAIAIQIPGILPPGETVSISVFAGGSLYASGSYTRPTGNSDMKLMGTIEGTSESEEISGGKEILWKLSISQQGGPAPAYYQSFVVYVYSGSDNKSLVIAQQNLMTGNTVNFSFIVAPDAVDGYYVEVRPVESNVRYAGGFAYYVRPAKGAEPIRFKEGGSPH